MTKKLLTFCASILFIFSIVGLAACNSNKIVETDYFRIELNRKKKFAIVLELTEVGREQEILSVPMFVEGLPVKQIGGNVKIWYEGDSIRSQNLVKLYIPHTVVKVISKIEMAIDSEVVIMLMDRSTINFGKIVSWKRNIIHPTRDTYDSTRPNVSFFYNYQDSPNQDYFWFDYITESNLFMFPPTPIRQGFDFMGWFLEPEPMTPWNNRMPEMVEDTLNLYAKWQEK